MTAPRSFASPSIAVWSWLPLGAEGVPTQRSEISLSSTAARVSRVTETRPLATTCVMRSTMPSSTTGVFPAEMRSSLAWSTLAPVTRWPSRGRHASDTAPTYPSPKMLISTGVTSSSSYVASVRHAGPATLDDTVEALHRSLPRVMGEHPFAAGDRQTLPFGRILDDAQDGVPVLLRRRRYEKMLGRGRVYAT